MLKIFEKVYSTYQLESPFWNIFFENKTGLICYYKNIWKSIFNLHTEMSILNNSFKGNIKFFYFIYFYYIFNNHYCTISFCIRLHLFYTDIAKVFNKLWFNILIKKMNHFLHTRVGISSEILIELQKDSIQFDPDLISIFLFQEIVSKVLFVY
jgi:hypothetical protein